jgi:hypothetical protein
MIKNLIISPTGENTLVRNWTCDTQNFDIHLLYYSENEEGFDRLRNENFIVEKVKGEKWHIIKNYLNVNPQLFEKYDNFWFPDDDLLIDGNKINSLFDIHKNYNLQLSQPASIGHTSFQITSPQNCKLRFTSFVEIMCPLMSKETLIKLINTFDITESGWGLDILWPKLLGYPTDKIAIIDSVTIEHTSPVGKNYGNRFSKSPMDELHDVMRKYSVGFVHKEYSKIF